MRLLLYGTGLVGTEEFQIIPHIRKRIKEVKDKFPEWKHYEIENNKGEIIERNTLIDWGFNPKAI